MLLMRLAVISIVAELAGIELSGFDSILNYQCNRRCSMTKEKSLLINQLKKSEILTSYNFARASDIVFSETLTHKQFDEIKDKDDIEIVF